MLLFLFKNIQLSFKTETLLEKPPASEVFNNLRANNMKYEEIGQDLYGI